MHLLEIFPKCYIDIKNINRETGQKVELSMHHQDILVKNSKIQQQQKQTKYINEFLKKYKFQKNV